MGALHKYSVALNIDQLITESLYEPDRKPGPDDQPSCWALNRRKFFVLADVTTKARGKLAVMPRLPSKR
jgi:hypothetical protein